MRKTLQVDIPAGIADEQRIRLGGRGHAGERGGPPGDLYVLVRVAEDERFLRDGSNLVTVVGVARIGGCRWHHIAKGLASAALERHEAADAACGPHALGNGLVHRAAGLQHEAQRNAGTRDRSDALRCR